MRLACIVASIATLSLTSCATAPVSVDFKKTAVIQASKDAVWERLIEYFASNNISIKTIDKSSGIVYAERSVAGRNGFSEWADCGSSMVEVPQRELLDLNVFVREAPSGTNVTVNTHFQQVRYNSLSKISDTADCNSLGVLEAALLKVAASS